MKIFGYRVIAVLSHNSDGGHFPRWPAPLAIVANISGSKPPRTMILVANTTFSRTKIPMELFTHDNLYFLWNNTRNLSR